MQVGDEFAQEVRNLVRVNRWAKQRRNTAHRFIIWQPVETLIIIATAAAAVVPTICFVYIVRRKRRSRPIVSIRACLRIDKETIEQSETKRERMMIGCDVLNSLAGWSRCFTSAEDRQTCISISSITIACPLDVAEDLIVGAILLDDVNHMFDGRDIRKKSGDFLADETVVAQHLLSVAGQVRIVRRWYRTDVSYHQRKAVLSSLSHTSASSDRKAIIGGVRCPARVVNDNGGVLDSRAFAIANKEGLTR